MNTSLVAAKLETIEMLSLFSAAQPDEFAERRSEPRHPLFAPVTLRLVDGSGTQLSAFSREISFSGVGLLHNMPLDGGFVCDVSINMGEVRVTKRAEVIWCRPAGEGWYLSGWRFVAI